MSPKPKDRTESGPVARVSLHRNAAVREIETPPSSRDPRRDVLDDAADDTDASGVHEVRFLEADLLARFVRRDARPRLRPDVDLRKLPLDPTSAFLLGFIDGSTTVDALLDVGGPTRDAIVRSLCLLFDYGVVSV